MGQVPRSMEVGSMEGRQREGLNEIIKKNFKAVREDGKWKLQKINTGNIVK